MTTFNRQTRSCTSVTCSPCVQANKDDQHSKKKAVENSEDPGGGRVPQPPNILDPNNGKPKHSDVSTDSNSKYLHKKFKKMASLRPDEEVVNNKNKDETSLVSDSTATAGRYVCPYCKLACAKPSVLQKHIRAHTNERPYPCRPCGFAFKTRSNLYKHCRSRAHSLKMEEEGISSGAPGTNSLQGSSEDEGGEDEDEVSSNSPVPVCAVSSSPTPTTVTNSFPVTQATTAASERPRQIYKPKFHKAALYQEEKVDQEKTVSESELPNLSYFNFTPSNPSPEYIQRHISKIISKNQEIVETSDPQWPKKFQQRQRDQSSPASPVSACSSPGIEGTPYWPKKMYHRQSSVASQPEETLTSKLALALLRPNRMETSPSPRLTESPMSTTQELPTTNCQQPLNLSTAGNKLNMDSNADLPSYNHRKLSYSETFPPSVKSPVPATSYMTVLKDHNLNNNSITNSKYLYPPNSKTIRLESTDSAISLLDDLASATKNQRSDKLLFHPQNPEGSIIKGLLLKRRAAAAAAAASAAAVTSSQSSSFMNDMLVSEPANLVTFLPTEEIAYHGSPQAAYQFVCSLCKISYHSADNLNIHQLYYCKGENSNKVLMNPAQSPQLSPKVNSYISSPEDVANPLSKTPHSRTYDNSRYVKCSFKVDVKPPANISPTKDHVMKSSNIVVPPFPSPGPLLGSTPLVDSYHQSYQKQKEEVESDEQTELICRAPIPKKRRLDSDISPRDASSTASSPDIRSLPTPPLSLVATLRSLEELSKCPMRANSLQMFGGEVQIIDAGGEMKTMRIEPSSRGDKSPCLPGPTSDVILNLPNRLNTGGILLSSGGNKSSNCEGGNGDTVIENTPPQIVVTIARSGLHSGGTLVVPHKVPSSTSGSPGTVKPPRSSGGSINCINIPSPKLGSAQLSKSIQKNCSSSGGIILNSPSPSSLSYTTSAAHSSNTNTLSTVFPDTTKLLVPNIATPNLAVPGIPPPNLGHHLPFMHFPSILHDGTLLNPLTHITAFNPLTLPPASTIRLSNSPNLQTQQKELHSPSISVGSRESNSSPFSGGVVTIIHDGKEIPYVPGMPGPQTLSSIKKPIENKKHFSVKSLDSASPSKESGIFKSVAEQDQNAVLSLQASSKFSKPKTSAASTVMPFRHISGSVNAVNHQNSKDEADGTNVNTSSLPTIIRKIVKNPSPLPSIKIDTVLSTKDVGTSNEDSNKMSHNPTQVNSRKISKTDRPETRELSLPKEIMERQNDNNSESDKPEENVQDMDTKDSGSGKKPKFLRPSTLPLKPGTFTPKKHHAGLTPTGMVLSLVSPETPRPKKSYGQLYLNGHAYTYLGLKCSARAYFCTLNRLQPMYVLLSPECAKVSMYSNWKVHSEATPHPLKLDPCQAMALYDSRHRPSTYTIARSSEKQLLAITHSSYWFNKSMKQQKDKLKSEKKDEDTLEKAQNEGVKEGGSKGDLSENSASGEPTPKRVKIFDGGFESNEEYTYVRGRGRGRYVCEECGIRCKKPSMLKKHIRTHTDVRPFTCKHCNFSFKTKGNLTKHMKSKAHYKKCIELGIVPVPTVVDDSYIDEERLARQQALRDSKLEDGDSDTDDDNDEDEDDDDEEEDDDDESMHLGDECEDGNKGKLEREAACSLLSLSQVNNSVQKGLVTAGLVPLHPCRPNTYPYNTVVPSGASDEKGTPLPPHTPTLSAISAQTEREKVSHNTGLALGLGGEGMIVAPHIHNANRYYFPSNRASSSANATTVTQSSGSFSGSWSDEGASDLDDSSICDSEISDSESTIKRESAPQQPIDLSNKASSLRTLSVPFLQPVNGARTPTTPISEILTPVSEPATLLASLCSSVERIPVANNIQKTIEPETTMLQAYLTERALQDVRMKQYQYHHNLQNNKHSFTMSNTENLIMSSSPSKKDFIMSVSTSNSTVSNFLQKIPKDSVSKEFMKTSPPSKLVASEIPTITSTNLIKENDHNYQEKENYLDTPDIPKIIKSVVSTSATEFELEKHSPSPEKSKAVEPKLPINNCGIVRNVVVCGIPIGGQPNPSSSPPSTGNNSILTKSRAEFLPPSSGPSPNYFGVTEDGRSICSTCNKTFSKPSQLRLHVNIHYFERPFRCESCAVSFRTKGHLQKHERSVSHQNKVSMNSTFGTPTTTNPRPFKCDDCKIAFRIHGHLAKHLRSKMHIMKLECVGKLPFGTYAEMEREGISLNEIDTTDCENSLESLQVLAQKLYDKDPSKLGQWDGERGEFLLPHPHLSGGDTSSDEGEPLPGYHSPQHTDQFSLQHPDSSQKQQNHLLVGTNVKSSGEEIGSKAKLPLMKQLSNAKCSDVRCEESIGKQGFRNKTSKVQQNAVIKQGVNQESVDLKHDQISHTDMSLKSMKGKSSVKEESNDNTLDHGNQNVPADLKFRILTSGNHSEMVSVNNKDCSNTDGRTKRIHESRKNATVADADYADDVEEDDEPGTKKKLSCKLCQRTFSEKGALYVHNFVEHDISDDDTRQPNSSDRIYVPVRKVEKSDIAMLDLFSNIMVNKGSLLGDKKDSSFPSDKNKETFLENSCAKFSASPNKAPVYNSHEQLVKYSDLKTDYQTVPSRHKSPVPNLPTFDIHHIVGKSVNSDTSIEEAKDKSENNTERIQFNSKYCEPESDRTNSGSKLPWKKKNASNVSDSWKELVILRNKQCQTSQNKVQSLGTEQDRLNSSAKIDSSELADVKSRQYTHCSSTTDNVGGEEKLNCDLCGKLQSSRESLQKHLLSHTQLRPFVCEYCDAGFTSQQLLQSHLEMHKQSS